MREELREFSIDTEYSVVAPKRASREVVVELELELGTKIGRYVLLEQIGRGGMGVIWAAYDPQLDRKVALKLLLMSGVASRTRLEREAQALARVDHENVVGIHDVGIYRGQVWLAMEFIDGCTLRAWLKAERPNWREVCAVMMQAGRGLAAAHAKGLVHRDFKPENVMIDATGRVVVMDFGLVRHESGPTSSSEDDEDEEEEEEEDPREETLPREPEGRPERRPERKPERRPERKPERRPERLDGVLEAVGERVDPGSRRAAHPSASSSFAMLGIPEVIAEDEDISRPFDTNITRGGAVMGTPAYMAPEQHASVPTDARADQFGFCVTLWEAVYGQRPFAGTSLSGLALSVTRGDIKEPPRGNNAPVWLRRVMERGLSPRRDDRFESMDALLDVLGRERRWRWLGVAALVTAVVLIAVAWTGVSLGQGRTLTACEDEGAVIRASWSEATRAELETAFDATGREGAARSWTRTRGQLDAWVEQWTNTRAGLCVEGEVEGTRSVAELEASRACLDQQHAGFEQLLDALATVDGDSLHAGVLSAAALPVPAVCMQRGRAPLMIADDPAVAERAAQLRATLHRAEAMRALGRYEESLRVAAGVVEDAQALAWLPVEAEALFARGRGELHTGAYEAAEGSLEASFIMAGRAHHEALMARAAVELVRTVGDYQARHAEGLRWAKLAALYFERAGILATPEFAALELVRGRVAYLAGDYEAAESAYAAALEQFELSLGTGHPKVAGVLNNIGNYHLTRGDYAASLASFARAERIYVEALGPEHPKVAVIFNNRGNTLRSQGRDAEALEAYERALELRLAAFGPEHPDVGTALNNLGTAYISTGRLDEALEVMTRALEIREAALGPEHPRVASTLNNLGEIKFGQGEFDAALGYYERALALRRASLGPRHDRVAGPLRNIGTLHAARGDLGEALVVFEEALSIYSEALGPTHARVISTLREMASVKQRLGEYASARSLLKQARRAALTTYGKTSEKLAEIDSELRALEREVALSPARD